MIFIKNKNIIKNRTLILFPFKSVAVKTQHNIKLIQNINKIKVTAMTIKINLFERKVSLQHKKKQKLC